MSTVKAKSAPATLLVEGQTWNRRDLDDSSGHWFELTGSFGELAVEESRSGKYLALWWPPEIRVGEAVQVGQDYKTRRAAMKAATAYLTRLRRLLGEPRILGLPA